MNELEHQASNADHGSDDEERPFLHGVTPQHSCFDSVRQDVVQLGAFGTFKALADQFPQGCFSYILVRSQRWQHVVLLPFVAYHISFRQRIVALR